MNPGDSVFNAGLDAERSRVPKLRSNPTPRPSAVPSGLFCHAGCFPALKRRAYSQDLPPGQRNLVALNLPAGRGRLDLASDALETPGPPAGAAAPLPSMTEDSPHFQPGIGV